MSKKNSKNRRRSKRQSSPIARGRSTSERVKTDRSETKRLKPGSGKRVNTDARATPTSCPLDKTLSNAKENIKANAKPANTQNTTAYFVDVGEDHAGQRVDNFLITHLKGVPKTHIYRIIRKGEVRVNKGRVKQTTKLELGDSVRIPPIRLPGKSGAEIDGARYEFLRKTILFEDEALLVINKPSGMAVHAGSGIQVGVIEALRALRTDIRYLELVHRLDRATSGCLVLAKKASALKILHEDFKTNSLKNKRLDKRYYALAKGKWQHGQRRITKALNTDARKHGERYVVVDEQGSYASSIVTPVQIGDRASLVEIKLLTGRTHQVRVHLQSEGHPLAGDERYGDAEFNKVMKQNGLHRLFLHASSLRFTHPLSGQPMMVEAALPKELNAVLNAMNLCIN